MATHRIDRINKEFLRRISEILQSRVKNEYVEHAIITNVKVSRDLGYARVLYTLLDTSKQKKLQNELENVSGLVRSILSREMKLRTIPQIHFMYDDSEQRAREMDRLLDKVAELDAVSGKD